MSRQVTSYYGADITTQFAWATTSNDRFNREQDLYRLAQAVEHHDHSSTRGLAVARIAASAITEPMYGPLSVSTRAMADLAITTAKLADGSVTDAKIAIAKMPLAGGVMTGNLQVSPTASPTTGYVFMGTAGAYVAYDGTTMVLSHPTGGNIFAFGDFRVLRLSAQTTGFMYFGNGVNNYFGWDGVQFNMGGNTAYHSGNSAPPPLGAMVAFRTLAELTAAGAKWARDTTANGRLLVGAGQAAGITETFLENTFYGSTWAPLTYMGYAVTAGSLSVSGASTSADATHVFTAAAASSNNSSGATSVSTGDHFHAVTGGALSGAPGQTNAGASFLPPMLGVIWGRRIL